MHKSTSTNIISTFSKIKQKQEREIEKELKDWELGVAVSAVRHNKKLCRHVALLDN
jgi:hypothetical protein